MGCPMGLLDAGALTGGGTGAAVTMIVSMVVERLVDVQIIEVPTIFGGNCCCCGGADSMPLINETKRQKSMSIFMAVNYNVLYAHPSSHLIILQFC